MGNWTPEGFVGKTSRLMSKFVPLPPGITPPVLWGDEQVVRQRFSKGISRLTLTRRNLQFKYPFSPKEVVKLFRQHSGPSKVAFAKLDEAGQQELASALQGLWEEHNTATDGTVNVTAEYLDVRAIRA
jgi:hypothetical protein